MDRCMFSVECLYRCDGWRQGRGGDVSVTTSRHRHKLLSSDVQAATAKLSLSVLAAISVGQGRVGFNNRRLCEGRLPAGGR
jgi:hypothetical protein